MTLDKSLKARITGKVGSALSAPARAIYGMRGAKAAREAGILKKARAYDNAPNFDGKGMPTDAFKMRSAAQSIRDKHLKKR